MEVKFRLLDFILGVTKGLSRKGFTQDSNTVVPVCWNNPSPWLQSERTGQGKGREGQGGDSHRKGRETAMEWNRVRARGVKKIGRKNAQRIGKMFGHEFVEDKEGEGAKMDSQAVGAN